MRESPQHAEQDLLGLEQRPPRGDAWKGAGAEQDGQRDARILEGGDARLHARQHVRLADEDRRRVGQSRHEDLVVALRRQPRDGRAVEAVELGRVRFPAGSRVRAGWAAADARVLLS